MIYKFIFFGPARTGGCLPYGRLFLYLAATRPFVFASTRKILRKAIKYGIRIAQAFDVPVEAITVSETDHLKDGYKSAVKWCEKLLRRSNISYNHKFLTGNAPRVINREASDNSIIVMGSSTKNPILKFIAGSKPLKVMKNCNCPILIVK